MTCYSWRVDAGSSSSKVLANLLFFPTESAESARAIRLFPKIFGTSFFQPFMHNNSHMLLLSFDFSGEFSLLAPAAVTTEIGLPNSLYFNRMATTSVGALK